MRKILLAILLLSVTVVKAQNLDTWTQVGMVQFPQNPSVQTTGMGRVSELVYHPTDSNTLYAVSASGGVWQTSNEGLSWKPLTDKLPRMQCASLCINPLNPNVMYLGTGDADYNSTGMGVWKSTDKGKTWTQSTTGMGNRLVSVLWINPTDTNMLLAAAGDGIYKSTNAGASWTKRTTVNGSYRDLVRKASAGSRTFFAATDGAVYRSVDMGDTWTAHALAGTPAGIKLGVSPADSNVLYAVAWSNGANKFGGLFKSVNDAASFTLQSDTPNVLGYSSTGSTQDGQGAYNLCIAVDPLNINTIYVGAICVWKSTTGGNSWSLSSPWAFGVHADKHHFVFSPYNPNKLYLTHDGGMDRTLNGGSTWTTMSDGLSASEFYKMGQSILRKEILIGGLQDNGLNIYRNGIFYTIKGGDWTGDFHFDHKDTNVLYFNGGNRRFVTGGEEGINGQGNYLLHPTDTNILFYGSTNLYRTTNLKANPSTAVNWTQISSLVGTATINTLAVSRSASQTVYFAMSNGTLFRCEQCASTTPNIVQITTKPTGNINQIILHRKDTNCIFISIGSRLYRSSNYGQSWNDISQNLPAINIVKVLVDESTQDTVTYVANALGIYYNRRFQSSWNTFSSSLPTIAPISDMEMYQDTINPDNSRIRISTYGRGIWQTDLFRSTRKAPTADFTVHKTTGTCNGIYILNDISINSPASRVWRITPSTGWIYINASDSLSRSPEIKFTSAGSYLVSLQVTNSNGTSYKNEYLHHSTLGISPACNPATTTLGGYTIGIYKFELNSINNSSSYTTNASPNGEDFTCNISTRLRPAVTYTAAVTNGNSYAENCRIYIDYNNNGTYETTELAGSIASGLGRRTTNITVPATGITYNTYLRLRVISDYNALTGPCNTLTYGQYEDYAVMIDSVRPRVSMSFTKPFVHKVFPVTFTMSKHVSGFDTSDIVVTNGVITSFTQTGLLTYMANVKPINNGTVTVSVPVGKLRDEAGNTNPTASDSTTFRLAFTAYTFNGISVSDSISITPSGGNVYVRVPFNTLLSNLTATYTTTDNASARVNSVTQQSAVTANSFVQPLVYTLTSSDNQITKLFTVYVTVEQNKLCSLLTYNIVNPSASGTVQHNTGGGSVAVQVPFSTLLTNLVAGFTVSDSAKVYINQVRQTSGVTTNDFTTAVQYKVVAQDTNYSRTYVVQVTTGASTACDMFTFGFNQPAVSGNFTPTPYGALVKADVPFGTSLTNLTAVFTVSSNATIKVNNINQVSGSTVNNFTNTVSYIVTAQDGITTKTYKVVVNVLPNTACDLLTFALVSPAVTGSIQQTSNGGNVYLTVPYGTNVNSLIAQFTTSANATVKCNNVTQQSGVTTNNFAQQLVYTVLSQSGSNSKQYTVNVQVLSNTACDLLSYALVTPSITGSIQPTTNGGNVNLLVSPSLNLTALTSVFTLSSNARATVNNVAQQSGVTVNDYSSPFNLVVHSQDSMFTKTYVVAVTLNTGAEELSQNASAKIYPNPSKGVFTFEYQPLTVCKENLYWSIRDVLGREIKQEQVTCENAPVTCTIDLQKEAKGIYYLHYKAGGDWGVIKLLVK